jgi:hypothetical protein
MSVAPVNRRMPKRQYSKESAPHSVKVEVYKNTGADVGVSLQQLAFPFGSFQ